LLQRQQRIDFRDGRALSPAERFGKGTASAVPPIAQNHPGFSPKGFAVLTDQV